MNTLTLPLDLIEIGGRLRGVDPEAVKRLVVSFGMVGQMTPIEVIEHATEPGRFVLISGAHRMAAAKAAGWTTIEAVVFDGDREQVRLREIEENLSRRELSPYEQSSFLSEWVEICQRLRLVPARGGSRRGSKSQAATLIGTYEEELARKFNISRATLFRSLRRRRSIDDAAWRLIAGTALANKGVMLDALCEVPREAQRAVVERFLAPAILGERRPSFVALCKEASGFLPPRVPPSRGRRQALLAAWDAADVDDRDWFIAQLRFADRAHLRRLLDKGE